jgi:hypothetical protein
MFSGNQKTDGTKTRQQHYIKAVGCYSDSTQACIVQACGSSQSSLAPGPARWGTLARTDDVELSSRKPTSTLQRYKVATGSHPCPGGTLQTGSIPDSTRIRGLVSTTAAEPITPCRAVGHRVMQCMVLHDDDTFPAIAVAN